MSDCIPVTVLLIDVDNFKAFNDAAGHPAGDGCLRSIAATLAATCRRPGGLVCRWGGEEFLAVLPDTDSVRSAELGRQTLAAIRAIELPHAAALGRVTVSIGAASTMPPATCTMDELIAQADRALYAAKRAGRDRLVVAAD